MTKQKTLSRLCALATLVSEHVYKHAHAHDCFCGEAPEDEYPFAHSEKVIRFIEEAVRAAIRK